MTNIVQLVNNITQTVMAVAWGMFILTWSIGWLLRGSPIPFLRVKRAGQDLIEDAIWAAFWLAVGTSVFTLVSYIASYISQAVPPANMTMTP